MKIPFLSIWIDFAKVPPRKAVLIYFPHQWWKFLFFYTLVNTGITIKIVVRWFLANLTGTVWVSGFNLHVLVFMLIVYWNDILYVCSLKGTWNLGDGLGEPWTDSASHIHTCAHPSMCSQPATIEGQVGTEQTMVQGISGGYNFPTAPVTFQSENWELTSIGPGIWQNFLPSSILEMLMSLFLLRPVGAPKAKLSPAENLSVFGKESSPSTLPVSVWEVPFQSNPLGLSSGLPASARFYFWKHPCYLVITIAMVHIVCPGWNPVLLSLAFVPSVLYSPFSPCWPPQEAFKSTLHCC